MVISASQTQPESVDAGSEVRHWSAEVNDVSLHVAGQGSAAGLVVLLLHGFSEMWLSWSHQMAALAPDLRGRRAPRPPLPPQNIMDTNPQLYFHLQQQKLIELIRVGRINEALEFAQEKLAPRGEHCYHADKEKE